MKRRELLHENRGFGLVEMMVVMVIFITVIMITTSAFDSIVSRSSGHAKSAQSNIEGIVGLEVFRADLDAIGFGLPWSFSTPVTYSEANIVAYADLDGIDPAADFNDAPSAIPRAILNKSSTSGVDYLVIKSTAVGMNKAAKRWSYLTYSSVSVGGKIKQWGTAADNLVNGDRAITINTTFTTTGSVDRRLVNPTATSFSFAVSGALAPTDFSPGDPSQTFSVYGVTNSSLRMPFNRADYFVHRAAKIPQRCAPGTGSLYKSPINHSGGGYGGPYPLVDCVLDLQVVFVLDVDNDGNLTYTDNLAGKSAADIRQQLKQVKAYILAQEGQKDRGFTYPASSIVVAPAGMGSLGHTWTDTKLTETVGDDWKNYRWKVYEIVVQPKNLNK
jgi:prepilin-type N-terminal cleavage/methylation domain-containing protein